MVCSGRVFRFGLVWWAVGQLALEWNIVEIDLVRFGFLFF